MLPQERKSNRKKRTLHYFLLTESGHQLRVFKVLFLNTLNISERQIRTVVLKITTTGAVESERRGGRQGSYIERDAEIHDRVRKHMDRYPRMESHYCRSTSNKEYLSHELTVTKMHAMYNEECASENQKVSFSYYAKVFNETNLSFHRPKKDQCGICLDYRYEKDPEKKETLKSKYENH